MLEYYTFEKSVNDNNKDLSLLIIAGIHGKEIGTISLAYDIIHRLKNGCDNKKELTTTKRKDISYYKEFNLVDYKSDFWNAFHHIKSIKIIPNCNMDEVRNQKTLSDLNRNWDCISARSFLKDIIDDSDIVIDLHCSPDQMANQVLLDIDQPDVDYIREKIKEMNIQYMIRGIKEATIKRYVNSHDDKLGITWEQMGYNYINKDVNDIAINQLFKIFETIGDIYWEIRTQKEEEKTKNGSSCTLARTIVSNTEGIVIPGISIINTPIYESPCLIDPGECVFQIQSFNGDVLESFYADEDIYLSSLQSYKWVNMNYPVAIIQPL